MDDSLSIILPVHDGQSRLAGEVEHLLDVAPELTTQFDLLIVDDGSRDGTEEIACELTARFAQVHYVRHPLELGWNETIHTALSRTDGDYLLVRQAATPLRADALPRLWATRDDSQFGTTAAGVPGTMAEESPTRIGWLDRLLKWGQAVRESHAAAESGLRLYRRAALAELALRAPAATDTYIEHLRRTRDRRQSAGIANREHVVPAPKSVAAPLLPGTTATADRYTSTR